MLFNSYIFILGFLPICVLVYFLLNRFKDKRYGVFFLLIMSLWFYGYYNVRYLLLILCSIGFNYLAFRLMRIVQKKKNVLILTLLFNIGLIFYYKYFNFFIDNINKAFSTDLVVRQIILPLGISFFTFQQISFVVDAYRGEVGEYSLLYYAAFVTFFPQMVAGPIVTHDELIPQFADEQRKQINWDNFYTGVFAFVVGLTKKVLLADTFGRAVDAAYADVASYDSGSWMIITVAYTLQIYFDFCGYSEMSIGMAKMLSIDLPLNFNSPYKAVGIRDFWDRWHMTLTRFLTKYIYIPLGGSRKGTSRTYINTMIVFLVSGIWHGANWTFVIWGLLHGALCVLERGMERTLKHIPKVLRWAFTFAFVNITWIIFRAESLTQAFEIISKIFSFDFSTSYQQIIEALTLEEINFVIYALHISKIYQYIPAFCPLILVMASVIVLIKDKNILNSMQSLKTNLVTAMLMAFLLVWCIFSLEGVSTFLYFNF